MKKAFFYYLLLFIVSIKSFSQRNNWDKNERNEFKKYLVSNSIIGDIDDWERFINNTKTEVLLEYKSKKTIRNGIYKVTLPLDPLTESIYLVDGQNKYFLKSDNLEEDLKFILKVLGNNEVKLNKHEVISLIERIIPVYVDNKKYKSKRLKS